MRMKNEFTVDCINCDWLTVGSFDQRNRKRWETVMGGEFIATGHDVKSHMYTGTQYEGGFVGQAEQGGRIHTICRATGMNADKVIYRLMRASTGDFRFTRIDIQLTIKQPAFHSARQLADHLKQSQKLQVRLMESNGLDTVYVGSRQSARMWRIYVKEDEAGKRYLRFEIEIKNGKDRLADRVANLINSKGHSAMVSYFFENIDRLSLPDAYISILGDFRGGGTSPLPKEVRDTGRRKFRWLDQIVKPTIIKFALESHGRSEFMISWLVGIIDEISRRQEPS